MSQAPAEARRAGVFVALDDLLRDRLTTPQHVREGRTPLRIFLPWALVLGGLHGLFIGCYALFNGTTGATTHMLAVMAKLPALFLFTLLVTFPSLYVFNALLGYGLRFRATLRLLVATIVVNLALASSLGPILAFFTVSTKSYTFIVLLNVAILGIGGLASIAFLLRTMIRAQNAEQPLDATPDPTATAAPAAATETPRRALPLLFVWIITYSLVGTQMGWLLRPFIGHPGQPITIFREREGSFVEAIWNATAGQATPNNLRR
ncbi:MAG: hypothetical protein K2Y21_00690 [Phycisphaerales bacterium]|nr:hypothetical protein [Phycisphaerales bacterium]